MIKVLGFIVSIILSFPTLKSNDIDYYRDNYTKATENKETCYKMIDDLENMKNKSAVYVSYLGGLQAIKAKYVFNPLQKLKTFKLGKNNIEKAIKLDNNNIEIRFIRLSIQKKSPSFLNYKSNIKEDTDFIKQNLKSVESEILRSNINQILKE